MINKTKLEQLFLKHGFRDFRWINPKDIIVSHWVRMKCMFGCLEYGKNASCPPNTPPVEECRKFFQEYTEGVVFHFEKKVDKPEHRHEWTRKIDNKLLKLESDVFFYGYQKAFMLFIDSCNICKTCSILRIDCKNKRLVRPTPEALGVDVFTSVKKLGYPIEVLCDYSDTMNRYSFLLIK